MSDSESPQEPALLRAFIHDLQLRKHITPRTVAAYLYDLRQFCTYLVIRRVPGTGPDLPPPSDWHEVRLEHLRSVTYDLVRDFLLQYESPVSSRHQQRKAAVLRSFFRYLVEVRELLDRNPTTRVHVGLDREQRRAESNRVKALTDTQLQRFMTNVRTGCYLPTERLKQYHQKTQARDWAMVLLFLSTGIRLSELAGISLGDLDLRHRTLRVRRKGGFADWIPLHDEAYAALTAYLTEGGRPAPVEGATYAAEPLFVATTTRRRLTGRQIENLVKKYAVTADPRLEFVSPHKLRHTFAQRLYDATGDLYLTAVSLAHQSVESAKIYAKVQEEQRRQAVHSLSWPTGTAQERT